MKICVLFLLAWSISLASWRSAGASDNQADHRAVSAVLDQLHEAASKADGAAYFSLFADDAVFLGTDAGERWTIDEFKSYAAKRFETGTGWTYRVKDGKRFITIGDGGEVAWFDELLTNAKYGTCRGSGVLRKVGDRWKVAQYNLAMMVPNDAALQVVEIIQAHDPND